MNRFEQYFSDIEGVAKLLAKVRSEGNLTGKLCRELCIMHGSDCTETPFVDYPCWKLILEGLKEKVAEPEVVEDKEQPKDTVEEPTNSESQVKED